MARLIFIAVFIGFFALNTLQERGFKARGLDTEGALPVGKGLFKLGKLSTLLCWAAAFARACKPDLWGVPVPPRLEQAAAALYLAGFGVLWRAFRDLGDANTTGLPSARTELSTKGVYAWSRNPLYAGLYLMTAGAVLYCGSVMVLLLGIAAVAVHHMIVLSEEKFLLDRFGRSYAEYKARTHRYI